MAKKTKAISGKKALISQIESKLTESLTDFPKKYSDKKYKKILHKAGKLISHSIATEPKETKAKKRAKKSTEKKETIKVHTA